MVDAVRTKTLLISSKLRSNASESPTKFTVNLDTSVDLHDVRRVVLKSFHCLNLFPNVASYENVLSLTVGGTPYNVTIPAGFYQADLFLNTVKDAITAQTPTTCTDATYDPFTYQVTLVCTDPFTVLSTTSEKSLNWKVGSSSLFTEPEALTWTGEGVLNLSGVTHLHIDSEALANSNAVDSDQHVRSTIAIIPVNSDYGSFTHWQSSSHLLTMVSYERDRSVGAIDITLRDHSGTVLELPSNAEVAIEFMVVFTN